MGAFPFEFRSCDGCYASTLPTSWWDNGLGPSDTCCTGLLTFRSATIFTLRAVRGKSGQSWLTKCLSRSISQTGCCRITSVCAFLNPDHRTVLRINDLDPNGVAGLLREVDLESLSVQFSPGERDEIIRGLQQNLDLVLRLPLHDRVNGGMTRITGKCYWEGSTTPGTLSPHVTLLRACNDPVLAAIQRAAHKPEFTPVELVRIALRIGPDAHSEAILGAIRELPQSCAGSGPQAVL